MKSGGYQSEATQFIREFLAKNPQVVEQQKKNRATWWDKAQDLATWKERAAATVPQPGYVYFPVPKKEEDKDSGNKLSNPSRPA